MLHPCSKKSQPPAIITELFLTTTTAMHVAGPTMPHENYNISGSMANELVQMAEEINVDDFGKVVLRTAKVVECEKVEKSRNLLKIIVEVGERKKQIISSISNYYTPEEMVGKTLIIIDNLKKAKFMGLESEGMLLAGETDDGFLSLVTMDRESPSGLRVS